MKKKIMLIFVAIVLGLIVFGSISVSAERYGRLTYYVKDGKAIITDYEATTNNYGQEYNLNFINYKVNGYEIGGIDDSAFSGVGMLKSIKLPDSLEFIGESAFEGCAYLESITIPDNVTSIGDKAFLDCTNLGDIELGGKVEQVGYNAFYNTEYFNNANNWCDGILYLDGVVLNASADISTVSIQSGTRFISNKVFYGNKNLKSVEFPDTLELIGGYAFCGCTGLTSIELGGNLTSIGEDAFNGCTGLTSIELGDNLTSIGEYAFNGCTGLTSITLNKNLTSLKSSAFGLCSNLSSIKLDEDNPNFSILNGNLYNKDKTVLVRYAPGNTTDSFNIPDSVTSIESYAFESCESLKNIIIPDSVTGIGVRAFRNCSGLESVTIGNNVTSIGDYAFYNCKALSQINWNAKNVAEFTTNNFVFAYAGQKGDGISVIFGDDVETIPDYAFYPYNTSTSFSNYTPKITDVTIGNSVACIGAFAFNECSSLESITIGSSVTCIEDFAFFRCEYLTQIKWNAKNVTDFTSNNYIFAYAGQKGNGISVTFGNSVEKIPANLFKGYYASCTAKITDVTISEGVTTIGDYSFYRCSEIPSITLPDSVTTIGSHAFGYCTKLPSIVIPDSVTTIGAYSFEHCSAIKEVYVGKNLELAESAFYDCEGIEKIKWNAKNAKVGSLFSSAGENGAGIDVIFGDNVEKIPNSIFSNCSMLKSVEMSSSVTAIGYSAFFACYGLEEITLSENLCDLGEYAFCECSSLNEIIVPQGVKTIKNNTFGKCSALSKAVLCGVENIGQSAFEKCSNLSHIEFCADMETIADDAFRDASALKELYVNDLGKYLTIEFGNNYSHPLYYKGELYVNNQLLVDVIVPEGITSIPAYSFKGCNAVKSVKFPESMTEIGTHAFSYCESLSQINLDDNINSISDFAFSRCTSLTNVKLGNNISILGESVFYNSGYYLDGANWENDLLYIGGYLVGVNEGIEKCYIKENTVLIAADAFGSGCCPTEVYITDLKKWCNIKFVSDLSNPCSVMAADLYLNGELVEELIIPDGVTEINDFAFEGINNIKKVVIPEGVTRIGCCAFYSCDSLTEVYIPNSVREVREYAFDIYGNIETVYYHGSEDEWNNIQTGKYNDPLINANKQFYYYVSFNDAEGTLIDKITKSAGALIDEDDIPQKEECSWKAYSEQECINEYDFSAPVTSDTEIYIKYTVNQYTYKFIDDNGDVLKTETVDYGTKIAAPSAPADKGTYTFDYWEGFTDGMTITGDVTFKAVYKYKTYKISVEGYEISSDATYGEKYLIVPVEKYGYEFLGYYSEENGAGTKLTDSDGNSISTYTYENDITVYPHFTDLLVNKAVLKGATSMQVGDTDVKYTLMLGTDREDIKYTTIYVKYPNTLSISKLEKNAEFEDVIQEKSVVNGDYTTTEIIVIYSDDKAMPTKTPIETFDIYFNVSKTAIPPQDITISLTNDSILMDSTSDYNFAELVEATATINPKLAESITIEGETTIDSATKYTAVIMPDYTTDKNVIWTVDNSDVASITEDGVLTPIKNGTVIITAKSVSNPEVYASKEITVKAYAKVASITTNGLWSEEFRNDIREYTVYVDEDMVEFNITPVSASGGRFNINGSTVFSNRTETVSLTSSETEITITLFNATGYTDSTYVLTVIKSSDALIAEAKTTESGYEFDVILNKDKIENFETAKIVLALYDSSNKFIGLAPVSVNGSDVKKIVPITTETPAHTAKVMLWNELETLNPLCKATEITLK